jgi:phosphoglycolate phosphatase-like HAD superfamily hydrolase
VGSKVLRKGLLKLDIDHFFEVVVSRNDVQAPKPSGEGMILALDRLQVKRNNAFYVGDSPDDIHAAKEAGIKVMIMMGGDSPKEDLLSPKPDFWVNDFGELIALLRKGAP